MTIDLLDLIARDTTLRKTSSHQGGEYSGPCPLCQTGTDRFKVWPQAARGEGRWACLGANAGRSGCDKGGDAIQYLCERDGLTYLEACDRLGILPTESPAPAIARPPPSAPCPCVEPSLSLLSPPSALWQAQASAHAARCVASLWGDEGERARAYLHRRGLHESTLRRFQVGYNPTDLYEEHVAWGLPQPAHGFSRIWLPRGITFPWFADGSIWRLNIRRPLTPAQAAAGETKYIGPSGFTNALYNADALRSLPRVAVLVEGEIDALTIAQACAGVPDIAGVAAVATGSTAGARRSHWLSRLAQIPTVFVAFDWDPPPRSHDRRAGQPPAANPALGAGERAAAWWLQSLEHARRLRPLDHDVNSMPDPAEVRAWIARALAR